jgi:hypothetical protein
MKWQRLALCGSCDFCATADTMLEVVCMRTTGAGCILERSVDARSRSSVRTRGGKTIEC